jgi:hypothetical protein
VRGRGAQRKVPREEAEGYLFIGRRKKGGFPAVKGGVREVFTGRRLRACRENAEYLR